MADDATNAAPERAGRGPGVYEALFEDSPVGILLWTTDGRVHGANSSAARLLGLAVDELVGSSVGTLVAPEDRSGVPDNMRQLMRPGGVPLRVEARYTRPDGRSMWVESVTRPVGTEGAAARYLQTVLLDISDRKASEEAQRWLAAIVQSSHDAIIGADRDGTIVSWNSGAEALLGYTAAEMIGRDAAALRPPGTETEASERLEQLAQGERIENRIALIRKDGAVAMLLAASTPIVGESGEVVGMATVARDLDEKERGERLVHDLLEGAPDATVVVAADGRVQRANQRTESLFGYAPADLVGQPVDVLLVPRSLSQHPRAAAASLVAAGADGSAGALSLEEVVRHRDGREIPVEVSVSPLETEAGRVISAAFRDVTERHEQLRQLRSQRDEILALSTPVIEVSDHVLVLPIIGTLDSGRAAHLTEELLTQIVAQQAHTIVLDISGVPSVDTGIAQHLLRTVQAARLMGADSILSGVRPEIAQSMVRLGLDVGEVRSFSTLKSALRFARQR